MRLLIFVIFQIYDYNDDNEICEDDLRHVVEALTNNQVGFEEAAIEIMLRLHV